MKAPVGGLWYNFTLPAGTPDAVRDEFHRLVRAAKTVGTFERIDPRIVENAARTVVRIQEIDEAIDAAGVIVQGPRGNDVVHPALESRNGLLIRLRACLNDMGLTAASSRLGDSKAAADTGPDKWAGLLGVTA